MRRGLSIPLIKPDIRKMQKLYYWFSEPIETAQYGGDADNDEYANAVRDATRAAVEHGCGPRSAMFDARLPGFGFHAARANCRGILLHAASRPLRLRCALAFPPLLQTAMPRVISGLQDCPDARKAGERSGPAHDEASHEQDPEVYQGAVRVAE